MSSGSKPTNEDVRTFIERAFSKIDIVKKFRALARDRENASMFEPIILPDGTLPKSERMSRGRDFAEAYKEIFGRSMEEDFAIQEALSLYEDSDKGPSAVHVEES